RRSRWVACDASRPPKRRCERSEWWVISVCATSASGRGSSSVSTSSVVGLEAATVRRSRPRCATPATMKSSSIPGDTGRARSTKPLVRLFLAINLPAATKREIADVTAPLRDTAPELTWVREPLLHLTLKFLGEQPEERLDEIQGTVAGIAGRHR